MKDKKLLKQKLNKPWIGLVIGLILPFLAVLIFYMIRARPGVPLLRYIDYLISMGTFLPIVSLATLVNLLPFYIGKHFGLWYANRGIVFSIFLYVIIVILIKFT